MSRATPKNQPKKPRNAVAVVSTGRQRIDWDATERDFRTGRYSQIELSKKHGMAEATLCRRIKADQKADKSRWQPDLTLAVRQATNAALMADLVNAEVNDGQEKVKTTVLVAAEMGKSVILGHRKGLSDLADVKRLLLNQIQQAAQNLPDLEEVIEMVRNPDENGIDRANDALRKAMGRSALVDDLKKLADVDEKVRKGEREAFSLDDAPEDTAAQAAGRYTDAERAVKLAYLMSQVSDK